MSQDNQNTKGPILNGVDKNDLETRGLCLLSLDGGGVRGLSSLYILRGLMQRLNDERETAKLPRVKPCEIFDLIGGTSTGGLIAIMLGRLELDVDECIEAYQGLMKTVFKKRRMFPVGITGNIKARFSSKALEDAIKTVIQSQGASVDDPFYVKLEDEESRKCRVFVCAKAKETNHIARLRAYRPIGVSPEVATIWEAALATSAAPTFFEPVQIGERMYVDGALGANNPAFEVEKEASNIWCEVSGKIEPLVKCFISIGTGDPGTNPVNDRAWKFLAESVMKVATETTETEEMFSSRWRGHLDERYFRFNVQQGLHGLGLAEYRQVALISAATEKYLDSQNTKPRVRGCVQNLRTKKYPPNKEFFVERARAQELEDISQRQETRGMTTSEISELMDRGTDSLSTDQSMMSHQHLINAYNDFSRALRATKQKASPTPKELAHIYKKLMSACLRLSYLLNFTSTQRMNYVREADKFGKLALANSIKSGNSGRIAQMQFYLTCVKAQEIQLRSEIDNLADPLISERDEAVEVISTALAELRTVENLDIAKYENMAMEHIHNLTDGIGTS